MADSASPPDAASGTVAEDPSTDPERLVEAILGGDESAEARLLEHYGRPVRLLLARHTRRSCDAEDLFQDTFHTALVKLRAGELRNPSRLPGFLARIARNLAIEHYRKAGRRKTDPDDEAVHRRAVGPSSQFEELVVREQALQVRRVIRELSTERDRQILFRYYIADEDKDAIAADLELDSLQFNRVLYRARERYRQLWEARREELEAGRSRVAALLAVVFAGIHLGAILHALAPLWELGGARMPG